MSVSAALERQAGPRLAFEQTVPRALVHRAAVSEVFVTDSVQLADDEVLVGAQLPRGHALFSDGPDGYYDPLLTLEAVRQAGTLTAHRHLGVPFDQSFVVSSFDLRVTDIGAYRVGARPATARVHLKESGPSRRDALVRTVRSTSDVSVDGASAASGEGTMVFLPRERYEDLRSFGRRSRRIPLGVVPAAATRIDPARVGRRDPRNVVISDIRRCHAGADPYVECTVVVDQSHPCLFDHPLDHVPAMLLIEAYRQTAVAVAAAARRVDPARALLTRCRSRFDGFAELELPVVCRASIVAGDGAGRTTPVAVQMQLLQGDAAISQALVEITALGDEHPVRRWGG